MGVKTFEYVHGLDIREMSMGVVSVTCGSATERALSRAVNTTVDARNVCDGVMKVTLVMKVCRFCKQILSMRLLCLCFSSIDVQNLHN